MNNSLPLGSLYLPFSELTSLQFEQFCTLILQKDINYEDMHRISGQGYSQYGIDICGKLKNRPYELVAIECKCWKNITTTEIKSTLENFLKNNTLKKNIKTYILILSQNSIPLKIEELWRHYQRKLEVEYSIKSELWTGDILMPKVQAYPEIINKFFPKAISDLLENKWDAKVNFIDNLHKALLNQDPKIRNLAESLLNNSFANLESLENQHIGGNHFTYKNKWVQISAILPSTNYIGSAAITITAHNTHGTIVTLDNKWLLKSFLGNDGEPINSKYRPFYQGVVYQQEDQHIIDFKNCRFHLPLKAVAEISKAADILTEHYISAFNNIEKLWDAQYFPFLSKYNSEIQIALCAIDKKMWELIQTFIHAHDIDKGNTEWHIFYAHRSYLQVHSSNNTEEFNCGFHGTFFSKNINFSDEITLVWQKPYDSSDIISDKDWWSCNKAFSWITEKLIPKVINWQIELQLANPLSKIIRGKYITNRTKLYWQKYKPYRDIRNKSLLEYNHFRELTLIEIISKLQNFYISPESSRAYFETSHIAKLYQSLIHLIKQGKGYFPYLRSKLVFDNSKCDNIDELIHYLNKKVDAKFFLLNNAEIELIFRSMLETLGDNDDWLKHKDKEEIYSALQPFMKFYDYANALKRYCEY